MGGFPCQPFSISGVSKKNSLGRPHGFEDKTQGTLFFEVARLIRDTKPTAFVLENVKNLLNHDKGRTMEVIYETLRDDLGYYVYPPLLLDAKFVVPQHRERVFLVGFRESRSFKIPMLVDRKPKIKDILENRVDPKYTLSDSFGAIFRLIETNTCSREMDSDSDWQTSTGLPGLSAQGITRTARRF